MLDEDPILLPMTSLVLHPITTIMPGSNLAWFNNPVSACLAWAVKEANSISGISFHTAFEGDRIDIALALRLPFML